MFGLTDREKSMLEKSWAKPFVEIIFPKIDKSRFVCLYSDKASRPNTPVNVCVGALILKELLNLTDDEMVESLALDVRFQYARHTTSFEEQPLSDKMLRRFHHKDIKPSNIYYYGGRFANSVGSGAIKFKTMQKEHKQHPTMDKQNEGI